MKILQLFFPLLLLVMPWQSLTAHGGVVEDEDL